VPQHQNEHQTENQKETKAENTPQGNEEYEDQISRLINEQFSNVGESSCDVNMDPAAVYKDNKLYDQPKKAMYGI
jgi:hypothetical protein